MSRLLRYLGPLLALALLALALRSLHQALGRRHWADVVDAMTSMPRSELALAALLTALSYLTLTVFDTLALHHVQRPLKWRVLSRVSFVAYALSLNIGLPALSASAVRLRLYVARGLQPADVARIMAFCFATTWVGYAAVAGAVFLFLPVPLPESFVIGPMFVKAFGVLLMAMSAAYLVFAWRRSRPLKLGKYEIAVPKPGLALLQLLASATQCLLAAGVAWVFLRNAVDAPFGEILGAFVLATIAGLLSHVPAGLGIADWVILQTLGPRAEPSALLGALLAWRLTYYIGPLLVAFVVLGLEEGFGAWRRRHAA